MAQYNECLPVSHNKYLPVLLLTPQYNKFARPALLLLFNLIELSHHEKNSLPPLLSYMSLSYTARNYQSHLLILQCAGLPHHHTSSHSSISTQTIFVPALNYIFRRSQVQQHLTNLLHSSLSVHFPFYLSNKLNVKADLFKASIYTTYFNQLFF